MKKRRAAKEDGALAQEQHTIHGPYWLRAHRDLRFWAAVLLMLGLMMVFVGTNDLAWWPAGWRAPAPVIGPK